MEYELHRVPTEDLARELERRAGQQWREPKPIPHCDECEHFTPFTENPESMPANYNACALGHLMRFRVPQHYDDVNTGNWGHYRRGCPDRKEAV